jgi:hypothetical protein
MENFITYATYKNGDQHQISVTGNMPKILAFVANYEGNDLGNDLVLEDFVDDFEETGVVIYAK